MLGHDLRRPIQQITPEDQLFLYMPRRRSASEVLERSGQLGPEREPGFDGEQRVVGLRVNAVVSGVDGDEFVFDTEERLASGILDDWEVG